MNLSFFNDVRGEGGEVFLVGGPVRDGLLGLPLKDMDLLVRGVPLEKLEEILARHGRVERVGKSFGVLKFARGPGETAIDVALPRIERSTGPGHRDFDVRFDPRISVEDDLGRRDFTINSLAREILSPEGAPGRLVDPFGGAKDLREKRLRQVFDRAFEEDPLRVLRGAQFAARFELDVEPQTLEGMKKAAPLLETLSPERVIVEMGKLFQAKKPSRGFYLLREVGALEKLFPEVAGMSGVEQPLEYHIADVFDHTMMALDAAAGDPLVRHSSDLEVMLGILYHDVGKPSCAGRHPEDGRITFYGHQSVSEEKARERLVHWRSPMIGAEPENVAKLAARHMFDTRADSTGKAIRRFVRAVGVELVGKLLDVALCDRRAQRDPSRVDDLIALRERIETELSAKPPLSVKDLAISGRDLLERGYKPGPALGNELARLLELVIEEPSRNTREFLLENLSPSPGQAG